MQVPRFEQYKGFWFVCFDRIIQLGHLSFGRKVYRFSRRSISIPRNGDCYGVQEYDVEANWKLLDENSFDDYHLHSTHSTWLEYMKDAGVNVKIPKGKGLLLPKRGVGKNLGNGHAAIDSQNFRGRPVAAWISIYGEKAKSLVEAAKRELIERLGEERAERVANTNRNLFVFQT